MQNRVQRKKRVDRHKSRIRFEEVSFAWRTGQSVELMELVYSYIVKWLFGFEHYFSC